MDIKRASTIQYLDDALNVKSKGYCGSSQTLTASITVNTNLLTTSNIQDFQVGQSVIVTNAGASTTIATPSFSSSNQSGSGGIPGSLAIGGGPTGSSTYGYRVAAIDVNGAYTAASVEARLTNCTALLGDPMLGTSGSWLSVWPNFDANAIAYAIYRSTAPSGVPTGYVGLYSYGGNADTGYFDGGLAIETPPNGIPPSYPSAPGGGYLIATIQSITYTGGTYQITLSQNALNTANNVVVYHDDYQVLQAALNSGSAKVYLPAGTYTCSQQLQCTTSGQTVYGDGYNTIITFRKVLDGISIQAGDVTIRDIHIDGAKSLSTGIATDNVPSGTIINDIIVERCKLTNILQQAVFFQNSNTDQWNRVTVRDNTGVNTLNGYYVLGNIRESNITNNNLDFTQYNYGGRGICLRNVSSPPYYPSVATIVGNNIRTTNHTAGITIQGSGKVTVVGNTCLVAGGVYGIYCLGDANYEGQTDLVTVTGNYFEALWPGTGVGAEIENFKQVTFLGNIINNFGYGFEMRPDSGPPGISDNLTNAIRISENVLANIHVGPISLLSSNPLGVKYTNNAGLNPLGVITPPVSPLASGVSYENASNVDITVYQQVYAATSGTNGSISASITNPSTNTTTTLFTKFVSGSTTSSSPEMVTVRVPQGYNYRFTTTNATLGTTSIWGD